MDELKELAEDLACSSRRARQKAAESLADLAKTQPQDLVSIIPDLADALNRPEPATRANCLVVLTTLASIDPQACAEALDGAELALFDEENNQVRLEAMRFLCALGVADAGLCAKAWPLIDEAIQCFHGDPEFNEMLNAVVAFSEADLAPEVKRALAARMDFDAVNARGPLQRKALQIIQNVK